MTTTTTALPAEARPASRDRDFSLASVARAELIKLTSLRSTIFTGAGIFLASIVVTILVTNSSLHQGQPHAYQGFDPTNQSLAGLLVAMLGMGALGALAATGEFATGTIRASLAAVPRRGLLVAAKAVVVGAIALVLSEATAFSCYGVGYLVLSHGGAPHASLGQPGVLRAVVLSGAFLALLALVSLGLGVVLRHTAGALSAYAGFTFVLPLILSRFPGNPSRFTPIPMLANSVAAVIPQHDALSATNAFGLMALYCAACLAVAIAVFSRRDA